MKILTQSVYILCSNREKDCAAASEHIFYVCANMWLLLRIFCFLRNVQLLLKRYLKKMCRCFLELCQLKKNFEVKEFKIKTMLYMYFWLSYCDGSHVERIPIAVIKYRSPFSSGQLNNEG